MLWSIKQKLDKYEPLSCLFFKKYYLHNAHFKKNRGENQIKKNLIEFTKKNLLCRKEEWSTKLKNHSALTFQPCTQRHKVHTRIEARRYTPMAARPKKTGTSRPHSATAFVE